MAARSTGMFPKYAAWVDTATILPANGDPLEVPNLQHSAEVHFVAYFSADAEGYVEVYSGVTSLVKLTAPAGGGKVIAVRSGYELGEVTSIALNSTSLDEGTVQVSVF